MTTRSSTLELLPERLSAAELKVLGLRVLKGHPTLAVRLLEQAVYLEPQEAANHVLLGRALFKTGAQARAEDCFLEASELDPKLENAWSHLASLRGLRKKFELAVDAAYQWAELNPKQVDAWELIDNFCTRLGRKSEALEAKRKLMMLRPKSVESIVGYALELGKVGLANEAIKVFERALELNPRYLEDRPHDSYLFEKMRSRLALT